METTNDTDTDSDSENESESDDEYRKCDTDWLAHTGNAYGVGYTQKQAVAALAPHASRTGDDPRMVDLIEHTGNVEFTGFSVRFENPIRRERYEIPPDEWNELRDAAIECTAAQDAALADSQVSVEDDDPIA